MKQIAALFMVLCLLSGCGVRGTETIPTVPETVPITVLPEPEPETTAPAEDGLIRKPDAQTQSPPTEATSRLQGQVNYSVLENDNSIRNDNGDVLVNIRYQMVILEDTDQQKKAINDLIQREYLSFQEETDYLQKTSVREWEKMLQDMDMVYGNLLVTRTAEVTNNSDGILSILMTQDWFFGGVYNQDYFPLNYDLNRGEVLPLARLSNLSEEEFASQLKTIVSGKLEEKNVTFFEDPAVVLEDYTLEDFAFYVEEGELVLVFPTYTFGPGAMGAAVVRTGLYPEL